MRAASARRAQTILRRHDAARAASSRLARARWPTARRIWNRQPERKNASIEPAARLPGFGQAKACILLFMYGSPSQLETFDPKPDAPLEIRGELGCIPSSVAGLNVCEGLPRLAQVMDKVSLIRSVTHPYPIHGVAFATSGIPRIEIPMELNPRDPAHWPFIGSVVDHVDGKRQARPARRAAGRTAQLGASVGIQQSAHRRGGPRRALRRFPGPGVRPDLHRVFRQGNQDRSKTLTGSVWEDLEPYRGITPESRFQLSAVTQLEPDLTLDRLDTRSHPARTDRAVSPQSRRRGEPHRHRSPPFDGLRPPAVRASCDGRSTWARNPTTPAASTA